VPRDLLVTLLRLGVAFVCGAALGWERHRADKPAGVRTHALISVGAATFTVASALAGGGGDPGRIAAQVVAGVGFIGAGVIIREAPQGVRGVTTAASIWLASALGLLAGLGQVLLAVAVTVLGLATLALPHGGSNGAEARGPGRRRR
jgi:putative Mg2+ transporter-C (MgtC) family protein